LSFLEGFSKNTHMKFHGNPSSGNWYRHSVGGRPVHLQSVMIPDAV
jgi:hypothetical protein